MTLVEARLDHLETWRPDVPTRFHLDARLAGGGVEVDGRAEPLGRHRSILATIDVKDLPLAWLEPLVRPSRLDRLDGVVDAHLDVRARSGGDGASSASASGDLDAHNLVGVAAGWRTGAASAHFNGTLGVDAGRIDVKGSVDASAWTLRREGDDRDLVRTGAARVTGLAVHGRTLSATSLTLDGVQLLQEPPQAPRTSKVEPSFLATSPRIGLQSLRLEPAGRFHVGTLDVEGLTARLERGPDGKIQALQRLAPETASARGASRTPWSVALGHVTLAGVTHVVFSDLSTRPNVDLDWREVRLQLSGLETGRPGRKASVELRARLGQYSRLRAAGTVALFDKPVSCDLKVTIQTLSLPQLNGYVAHLLGYLVTSGRLDLTSHAALRDGKLDGHVDTTLSELEVRGLPDTAAYRQMSQRLPVSVPTALSLLRDSKGDIKLSLPVSGDLDSPTIGWSGAVRTALGHAIQKAALLAFAPLGAVIETARLAGRETTLRFDPVPFAPGSATLSGQGGSYLDQMAGILKQHVGARVVLCGRATGADRQSPSATSGTGGASGAGTAAPDHQALLNLANARALAVKEYLVAHGVAAGRLYLCAPQVDETAGARPRVEVSA